MGRGENRAEGFLASSKALMRWPEALVGLLNAAQANGLDRRATHGLLPPANATVEHLHAAARRA
eukprot:1553358-Lingulodinium_polyedra.AAC.1